VRRCGKWGQNLHNPIEGEAVDQEIKIRTDAGQRHVHEQRSQGFSGFSAESESSLLSSIVDFRTIF
jgi:hypothetical protein